MTARLRDDARIVAAFALLVVLFGVLARGDAGLLQAGTYVAIFAPAAIGLSVLLGNVNQISVGQAGFFGIGAYAVGYCTVDLGWPFWVAAPVGIVVAALVGVGLGFIALRFRGHYLAMATLAFGLIAVGVFHAAPFLGRASGITGIPYPQVGPITLNGYPAYWGAWVVAMIAALLTLRLLQGRTGRAFEAIRNDEVAAEAIGVQTRRYKIFAFAYAGALAAAGGAMFAPFLGLVNPDAVGVALSVDFLLMVVLGGAGLVSGALFGAALIGYVNVVGHQYDNWREVAYGVLVIAFVVFAPAGVLGMLRAPFARARERAAALNDGTRSAAISVEASASATAAASAETASSASRRTLLEVRGLRAGYGALEVLHGVDIEVREGELVAVLGANGAGKSTLLRSISHFGSTVRAGTIAFDGNDLRRASTERGVRSGCLQVPEGRQLFRRLSVDDNLRLGAFVTNRRTLAEELDAVYQRFPALAERRAQLAYTLSGGEQQMLAIGRALMAKPKLLLLDEPSTGLAPQLVEQIFAIIVELARSGTSLLLVEQNAFLTLKHADRAYVLENGRVALGGSAESLRSDERVRATYLGGAAASR